MPKRRRGRPRKHPLPTDPPAPAPEGARRRGRPPKGSRTVEAPPPNHSDINSTEVQEKLRFLIRLAKEQEHLTFDDLNEALPNGFVTTDLLDEIITRLRNLEIDIVDPAAVDRVKARRTPQPDEDDTVIEEREEAGQVDVLDDPVRMYLKQMGQVPLLTRDQEIAISKRIEKAEATLWICLQNIGFIASEYLHLGEALMGGAERFDKLVTDRKIDDRESYFKKLQQTCGQVRDSLATAAGQFPGPHGRHRPPARRASGSSSSSPRPRSSSCARNSTSSTRPTRTSSPCSTTAWPTSIRSRAKQERTPDNPDVPEGARRFPAQCLDDHRGISRRRGRGPPVER